MEELKNVVGFSSSSSSLDVVFEVVVVVVVGAGVGRGGLIKVAKFSPPRKEEKKMSLVYDQRKFLTSSIV